LEAIDVSSAPKPVFPVPVRELVEFVHRTGDLGGDGQFMAPNRALAGTLGHQWLQRSRPPKYQSEVRLSHDVEGPDFILRVQGRLDGVIAEATGVRLEEIKTVGQGWDGQPDPLHWAQAKCYAYIYARQQNLDRLVLQLTYLNLDTKKVTEICEPHTLAELSVFFDATLAFYEQWMSAQFHWRQARDASIRPLAFPFSQYRPGQRQLAVAAYQTLARGERLFLEAPTGIGKTISVLFPAVKALGEGHLERIFYLTATTLGRVVAEKAAADLRRSGLRLRTLTLTAKSKLCVQNGQPCDVRTCPLALGYYDRRHAALRAALAREEITRPVLETIGQAHQVCPFELSLDLSEWVDAVICDYNYVFDPRVYLRRHFAGEGGAFGLLVDEAHNLVDRAREMFSAGLDAGEIREVAKLIKKSLPRCAKALSRLNTALNRLASPAASAIEPPAEFPHSDTGDLFDPVPPPPIQSTESAPVTLVRHDTRATREFPAELTPLLEQSLSTAADWLAKNLAAAFREPLLQLYFQLNAFICTAELYDERYVTLWQPGQTARVKLFCLDPSHLLRQAMARGRATICFSATLTPMDYYRTLLGGRTEDRVLQLPSPFPPENLRVLVQDRIRTQFKDRADSLGDVVAAIRTLIAGRAGNYLVYLPSYQYLTSVLAKFQSAAPEVPVLVQRPGMTETEREQFLATLAIEVGRTQVGFAVMGGIFGEGIDLVGERLIGAVIVGVGLPQLEAERDLIADYFAARHVSGFDYAYTFPGMNRVLQAIGRVIRSETDRGVVLLLDRRFGEARYRRLFPAHWRPVTVRHTTTIGDSVREFWAGG
jgi:Rad3-related DNA helicase